jgi:hypothetical protein
MVSIALRSEDGGEAGLRVHLLVGLLMGVLDRNEEQ